MFKYFNPNPNKRASKQNDCVIRSISLAMNQSWTKTYDDLSALGRELGDWGCYITVWGPYLRKYNYKRYNIPNSCPDCYTIADFAYDHPIGIFIVATQSHLVTVMDGDIYDSWDSSNEVPQFYFIEE